MFSRVKGSKPIAISGINVLKVGKTTIALSNETAKMNPNSIRFVVGHFLNCYFGGTRKKAAMFFRRAGGKYRSNRDGALPKSLNIKALSDLLDDTNYVAYWHLESIARSMKFPTGALLCLTRVYSLVRDGKIEATGAFIRGLRLFADELESLAQRKTVTKEDFDRMIACFEKTYDAESPDLFER